MQQTQLKTTELGSTGLRISRVGFGAWAIGGGGWAHGWGEQDDDASVAAIRQAVESGVNWIDTAAVYGLGHSLGHVDSLQPPFSLINQGATDEIGWCHAHHTGVIVYSPMQSGLLTGAFTAQRAATLPADDWRSRDADFTGEQLHRNLALVDALRPIADRHATTVATIAVAWCLAHPGVTAAIVGARGPGQVDGWIGAPDIELTAPDLTDIADAVHRAGAGHGWR